MSNRIGGQNLNGYPDSSSIYVGGLGFNVGQSGVLTASINTGGTFVASDGAHTATQDSSSGIGTGATFTVTITTDTVASIDAILTKGNGYSIGDTITLTIATATTSVQAILDVDTVG